MLHDWDVADCRTLVGRCASALPPGGQLLIHDVFLNDDHDGPVPIALYSAALFRLTEGRAYSAAGEYRGWLREAGLGSARSRRRSSIAGFSPVSNPVRPVKTSSQIGGHWVLSKALPEPSQHVAARSDRFVSSGSFWVYSLSGATHNAMMIAATDIRRGMVITMEGTNFVVVDFAHHTPATFAPMVQTKLRNIE